MKPLLRTIRLLGLACLLAALSLAWNVPPGLADASPCAGADFLLAQEDYEAARDLYLKLLENPQAGDCAQAGLIRLAKAQKQVKEAEKIELDSLPQPLVEALSVVGVQRCPSLLGRWLKCGTRFIGWPALVIPLSNPAADQLAPLPKSNSLLVNSDSGQTLRATIEKYETRGDRAAARIEVAALQTGNGNYSGKFDLLPADKDRGAFTLELKLRDSIWWALLTVLLGVWVSTWVRIYVNKYLPARQLDTALQKLSQEIEARGISEAVASPQDAYDRRLKRYDIRPGSQERIKALRTGLIDQLAAAETENLKPVATESGVVELYAGKQAEEALLAAIQSLAAGNLLPAHARFKRAWGEAQKLAPATVPIRLLELAEDMLYSPQEPGEIKPLGSAAALGSLKTDLAEWNTRLALLGDLLYRLKTGQALVEKIEAAGGQLPPKLHLRLLEGKGGLLAAHDLLRLELNQADLQALIVRVDRALEALQTVWAQVAQVRREAWQAAESLPLAILATEPARESKGFEAVTALKLTAGYFAHWPNAISLVLALAFALSTLYFGKTFGSAADYLAALAWGLGVDIATKTIPGILTGLGIGKG